MKRLQIISLVILFSFFVAPVHADFWQTAAYTGAILDTATTIDAMHHGHQEMNPIIGKNPNNEELLLSGLLQVGLVFYVNETWSPPSAKMFNQVYSTIKISTALNNFRITYTGKF